MNANIWKHTVQSLHSATIDSLNEALPDVQLELGLPVRFNEWKIPCSDITEMELCVGELTINHSASSATAYLCLLIDQQGLRELSMSSFGVFSEIIKKASIDLKSRGFSVATVSPTVEGASDVFAAKKVQLAVWFPIGLIAGSFKLGIVA